MASEALTAFNLRSTPQTEKADPRQVKNNAGGYTFQISDRDRLHRFLMTGSEGTYYVNAKELTRQNAEIVINLAKTDGLYLVEQIVAVSDAGRAPKQDAGLFALAIASVMGDDATRRAAYLAIPRVCRTGSTLFRYNQFREQLTSAHPMGWRKAMGRWYLDQPVDKVAYQAVKYRQRYDWTHRDLLRLAKPVPRDPAREALFRWVAGRDAEVDLSLIPMVEGFIKAQEPGANVAQLVADYRLPWEALTDESLGRTDVWNALIDNGMPLTALIRQLPRLTRLGLLPQMGGRTADVVQQITNGERLRTSRVHPMAILIAQRTYEQGYSLRGSSTWTPNGKVIDALDKAFYASYGNVPVTGKRTLLALDVSGSMASPVSADLPITCREASAAIALVTMNVEPQCMIVGYSQGLTELAISPKQRLSDATRAISGLPFQGTDCSLPFKVAKQQKWELDTVASFTDSETWAGGPGHTFQALNDYRAASGIPTRSIVVGMTSTGLTVNDPRDPLGLDIAGLDSSVPQFISDFSAGV